ncbi:hypothetical protein [Tenacibaculum sp. M341]|uniref:hypothetical protein n=1 Tax=Tenacibaculum sp. M341 TaxID=2530339 RepID=UPI001046033E|nr:hypothetical protein [Tenacibaculum sp. M341]TCI85167.1 hypothetical protein EYW44_17815 [Tenacibaculum sp. M341]
MKETTDNSLGYLVILLIGMGIFFYVYRKEKSLSNERGEAKGKIIDARLSGRKKRLVYVFYVKGRKYKGEVLSARFDCANKKNDCIGEEFFVIYDKKNPKKSVIDGKYISLKKN